MLGILYIVVAALLMTGIINRTRSILSGRKGVPVFQHLYNLKVLWHKGAVYSTTTGVIFKIAPIIYFSAILCAMLLVPIGAYPAVISISSDFVIFSYLLAFGRFALVLGAMDTGSSFEGMGSARDSFYGALIEPALFTLFGSLALMTGYTSFQSIFMALGGSSIEVSVIMLLLTYILIKVIIVECGRIPIDDPRTHLELTMIHEVMILDYSGIDMAMILAGNYLKMSLFAVLAAGTFASTLGSAGVSALAILLIIGIISIGIGVSESFTARNRLSRNATYILTIAGVATLSFFVVYLMSQNINI